MKNNLGFLSGFERREGVNGGAGPGGEEGFTPDARGRLMQEVAAQMDAIEADYGENFQIGRVVTIVEVLKPETEELDSSGPRPNAPVGSHWDAQIR
jgi:hypothetical protein